MRVAANSSVLAVEPGTSTALTIDVINTNDVIAGVSANVIGLATEYVSSKPQLLPLFPDSSGQVTLDLIIPAAHPAGRHPLTVELVAHGTAGPPDYIDVDLQVAAHPGLRITTKPRIVRARRSGRFVLELVNTGNVALDVALTGKDPDRAVEVTFTPDTRRVEPGSVMPVLLNVRGPRMFTGAEIDRTVEIEATARPVRPVRQYPGADDATTEIAPVPADSTFGGGTSTALLAPSAEPQQEESATEDLLVRETSVRLRQKPMISRGLLTVLILLGIIGLWAGVFLLGLGKVFAGDPMTKQAPASFFASTNGGRATGTGNGNGGADGGAGGAGGGAAAAAADAPAGALSKSGQVPPGTGGEISGKVTASTNQQPVGRLLVTAYRRGPKGLVQMSSAATQTDGTYTLAGLFPTKYVVKFSRSGFDTVWFPNQKSDAKAQQITAVAQGSTTGIDAVVTGDPASISGKVNQGDTRSDVTTTVRARALLGPRTGKTVATTTAASDGSYTLRNLPAPGNYELTFVTPGYQSSTLVDTVSGGDKRIEPTVTLGASAGQIGGTVSADGAPLGGATVTTTVAGKTVSVGTPTTGQVGTYVLGNLPTPATYVVTVSSPGHGSRTQIVDLAAGASATRTNVALSAGTGSVTGRVIGPDGNGLGGAVVTVGGAATSGAAQNTTTITDGPARGTFVLNGLGSGSYTLTATSEGLAATSQPVTLPLSPGGKVVLRLGQRLGSIKGTVTSGGNAVAGATVTATNGQRSFTATASSAGGGFLISDLEPGSYSVTVTATGKQQRTALVTVEPGAPTTQTFRIGG